MLARRMILIAGPRRGTRARTGLPSRADTSTPKCQVPKTSTSTADGRPTRHTDQCGTRMLPKPAGPHTTTDTGNGLVGGDGPGSTMRHGDGRPSTTDGGPMSV